MAQVNTVWGRKECIDTRDRYRTHCENFKGLLDTRVDPITYGKSFNRFSRASLRFLNSIDTTAINSDMVRWIREARDELLRCSSIRRQFYEQCIRTKIMHSTFAKRMSHAYAASQYRKMWCRTQLLLDALDASLLLASVQLSDSTSTSTSTSTAAESAFTFTDLNEVSEINPDVADPTKLSKSQKKRAKKKTESKAEADSDTAAFAEHGRLIQSDHRLGLTDLYSILSNVDPAVQQNLDWSQRSGEEGFMRWSIFPDLMIKIDVLRHVAAACDASPLLISFVLRWLGLYIAEAQLVASNRRKTPTFFNSVISLVATGISMLTPSGLLYCQSYPRASLRLLMDAFLTKSDDSWLQTFNYRTMRNDICICGALWSLAPLREGILVDESEGRPKCITITRYLGVRDVNSTALGADDCDRVARIVMGSMIEYEKNVTLGGIFENHILSSLTDKRKRSNLGNQLSDFVQNDPGTRVMDLNHRILKQSEMNQDGLISTLIMVPQDNVYLTIPCGVYLNTHDEGTVLHLKFVNNQTAAKLTRSGHFHVLNFDDLHLIDAENQNFRFAYRPLREATVEITKTHLV